MSLSVAAFILWLGFMAGIIWFGSDDDDLHYR